MSKRQPLIHVIQELSKPLLIHGKKFELIMDTLGPRVFLGNEPLIFLDDDDPMPTSRKPYSVNQGVAVVPISGTLANKLYGFDALSGGQTYQGVYRMAEQAAQDKDVKAILFDINSPGGTVAGCFDVADKLFRLRKESGKPMVALSNESMYSGAYALGSAIGDVRVNRTSGVGSVGVIMGHVDVSRSDEMRGIKYTYITAGKFKAEGNPHEPLSKETFERFREAGMRTYDLFCSSVASYRNMDEKKVRATEADCFDGSDAVSSGLADKVSTYDEVVEELASSGKTVVGYTKSGDSRSSVRKGPSMEDPKENVVDLNVARTEGATEQAARSLEIVELCQLAGMPHLASEMLRSNKSVADVRAHLMNARASAQEQQGNIDPHASTQSRPGDRPKVNKGEGWDKMLDRSFGAHSVQKVN